MPLSASRSSLAPSTYEQWSGDFSRLLAWQLLNLGSMKKGTVARVLRTSCSLLHQGRRQCPTGTSLVPLSPKRSSSRRRRRRLRSSWSQRTVSVQSFHVSFQVISPITKVFSTDRARRQCRCTETRMVDLLMSFQVRLPAAESLVTANTR